MNLYFVHSSKTNFKKICYTRSLKYIFRNIILISIDLQKVDLNLSDKNKCVKKLISKSLS